jgi:hypothetical protein
MWCKWWEKIGRRKIERGGIRKWSLHCILPQLVVDVHLVL